jgi:hypothetical protein
MSWKQAASLVTIIFVLTLLQSLLADPVYTLETSLLAVDFGSPHFDGASLISGLISSWFNMGLVAVFVVIGVALARTVRKELTVNRRGR